MQTISVRFKCRCWFDSSADCFPGAEELRDDGVVGHCARVAELVLVAGDLAQDPAQDLAGPGLGEGRGEVDVVRRGERADLGANWKKGIE